MRKRNGSDSHSVTIIFVFDGDTKLTTKNSEGKERRRTERKHFSLWLNWSLFFFSFSWHRTRENDQHLSFSYRTPHFYCVTSPRFHFQTGEQSSAINRFSLSNSLERSVNSTRQRKRNKEMRLIQPLIYSNETRSRTKQKRNQLKPTFFIGLFELVFIL